MSIRFAKGFLLLLLLFGVSGGCQRSLSPEVADEPIAARVETVPVLESTSEIEPIDLDEFRGSKDYVTSATCQKCHTKQHSTWESTYHRTMTQEATPSSIQGNFDAKMVQVGGYPCIPGKQGDKYFMTVVHPAWDEQEIKAGRDPHATPLPPAIMYSVDRVIGSHHQQVYLSRGEDGAYHTLPMVWNIKDKRWITRKASFLAEPRPNFFHKTKQWNNGCIFCHNTGPEPGLQQQTLDGGKSRFIWNSKVAELGIACEACHGPGGGHSRLQQELAKTKGASPSESLIVNPLKLSKEDSVLTCARCHGKMIAKKEFDRQCLMEGDFFRPGESDFVSRYDVPSRDESKPFEEHVDGKYFWSDGTPRTTALEYQGTLLSACYKHGEMTCLSCHSMHNSAPNDQLKFGENNEHAFAEQNRACTQCHEQFKDDSAIAQHTHHSPGSTGSLCYNCHMPYQAYSLLKRVRSHRISIPTANSTLDSGIPNACNQCHVDQSLDWTNRSLAKWTGKEPTKMDNSTSGSATAAHALTGNAFQRALAIEQLGAPENFELSGVDWRARVLLESLDDRYEANRYLAYRALQKMPGFEELTFDYIAPETDRAKQIADAKERWQKQETESQRRRLRTLLGGDSEENLDDLIDRLKKQRPTVAIEIME